VSGHNPYCVSILLRQKAIKAFEKCYYKIRNVP
jgi:hypothetical protein